MKGFFYVCGETDDWFEIMSDPIAKRNKESTDDLVVISKRLLDNTIQEELISKITVIDRNRPKLTE